MSVRSVNEKLYAVVQLFKDLKRMHSRFRVSCESGASEVSEPVKEERSQRDGCSLHLASTHGC